MKKHGGDGPGVGQIYCQLLEENIANELINISLTHFLEYPRRVNSDLFLNLKI